MFGTINVGAMGIFSLLIPETKGRSLEELDIIFGAISAETRRKDIERQKVVLGGMDDEAPSPISSSDHKISI